jgi:hypothetical protein
MRRTYRSQRVLQRDAVPPTSSHTGRHQGGGYHENKKNLSWQNRRDVVKVLDHPGPTFFCHGYWLTAKNSSVCTTSIWSDVASILSVLPSLSIVKSGSLIRLPWSVLWWWATVPRLLNYVNDERLPGLWRTFLEEFFVFDRRKQIFQHSDSLTDGLSVVFDSMNWSHIFKCSTTSMIE